MLTFPLKLTIVNGEFANQETKPCDQTNPILKHRKHEHPNEFQKQNHESKRTKSFQTNPNLQHRK